MNQIIFDGRTCFDADVKTAKSGAMFTKMRVANSVWSKKDGEKTNFIDVILFKELNIPKGTGVIVEGELEISEYGEDEERKKYTKVIARRITAVKYLSMKDFSGSSPTPSATATPSDSSKAPWEDDIPF